jgi:hypothetical protein
MLLFGLGRRRETGARSPQPARATAGLAIQGIGKRQFRTVAQIAEIRPNFADLLSQDCRFQAEAAIDIVLGLMSRFNIEPVSERWLREVVKNDAWAAQRMAFAQLSHAPTCIPDCIPVRSH